MKPVEADVPLGPEPAAPPAMLRVLLLEDDPCDAELIAAALQKAEGVTIELTHVDTLAEARALLAAGEYRLTLSDLSVSDSRGADTVARLVEVARGPVIALTGSNDTGLRAAAIAAGAYDFLGKGELKGSVLARVIRLASVQSRTAETLHEIQERYRELVEQLPDAILIHCNGRHVYANAAAAALFGAGSPERLLGWNIPHLVQHADPEPYSAWIAEVEAGRKESVVRQFRVRRLDGTIADVEGRSLPFTYRGEPAAQVILRDISARVALEGERVRSERRFRALIENSADGITLLDRHGKIVYGSPAAERIFGYRKGETSGMSGIDLAHPEDRALLASRFAAALASPGGTVATLLRFRHKDGSVRIVDGTLVNLLDDPSIGAVVANYRDVTERERAAEALRENEERYRLLVETSPDAIFITQRRRIALANAAALHLFGAARDSDLVGREAFQLVHPDDHAIVADRFERLQRGEAVPRIELRYVRLDGRIVTVESSAVAVSWRGALVIQSIARDVTERKLAEARMARLRQMYAALSDTNEAILRTRSAETVYSRVCELAVQHGGFAIAAIRLIDPATGEIVPAKASGQSAHWMQLLNASVRVDEPSGRGAGGVAAREGKPAFTNDMNASPCSAYWLETARAAGIASTASLPIRRGGKVIGIFSVFAREAGYFDDELMRLLERMAENVSFALDGFDRETERHLAEERLRESEVRFRTVVDSLNEGILVYDYDCRIVSGNAMAERILGVPLKDMIGKSGFSSLLATVDENGEPLTPENRPTRLTARTGRERTGDILGIRRPDGSITWLSINTALLRRAGAVEHYGIVSTLSDITQRREAELALRESEERFRSLTGLSSDFYWETDEQHRFCRLEYGQDHRATSPRSVQLGRMPWEIPYVAPEAPAWKTLRATLDAHRPFRDFQFARRAADGEVRYYATGGEPIFDEAGHFRGYRGVGRDISSQKRFEARILRLSRLYSFISEMNETIIRAKSPDALLERVCDIAIGHREFATATVYIAEPATRWLRIAAVRGKAEAFIRSVRVSMDPSLPEGRGLLGRAIRNGTPTVTHEFQADPRLAPWHEDARMHNIHAGAAFPLARGSSVFGALMLHAEQRDAFDDETLALLGRLAENVSVALANFDHEEARERAQQRVRESEERFRRLIALSTDWYWEQDEQFRYTVTSGNRLVAPNALLGKRQWEAGGVPVSGDWSEHKAMLEAQRPFRDFQMYRELRGGERRYFSVDGEPMYDAQQRFKGYRGIVRDITTAKRAEELLRLEHTVARRLADADNAATGLKAVLRAICETQDWESGYYLRVDPTAGVLRFDEFWSVANPAIERFTEGARHGVFGPNVGLAGKVWQSGEPLWVADSSIEPGVIRKELMRESGMRGAFLFPVTLEGKTIGVVAFFSREVREPDERLLQSVGVIGSQIGQFLQRKQAEAALREREERFRSLTQLSSDWYWEQDAQFRFTWLSNDLEWRTGVTQEALLGKTRWELEFAVPLSCTWQDHRNLVAAHEPFRELEYACVDKDGRATHYVSISGLPIFDETGRFRGYRGVGRNITDRKRTEERLVVHLAHQQLVAELGRRALSRKDLSVLLDDAVLLLAQGLRVAHAALYELSADAGTLTLCAGTADVQLPAPHTLPAGQRTPLGMALAESAPTLIGDIARDDRLVVPEVAWARGLKSWVSVSIRGGARPWGVLVAGSPQADAFGADAAAFVEAAASVLSSALLRHESESRLAYLAQFDALTGLPNRTLVRDRLERTIAQARRKSWLVGVLFVDLDRFKLVNDTLGHQYGDRLLAEVGKQLAACVRNGDTVGRVSGDEFVVILADLTRADDAGVVAQKIIDALSQPFVLDGHEAYVSASVGVALFPNDSEDAESLLRDADAAMYRAKETGRSGYCFFTAEMNARSRLRLQLQAELRRAIERDEFRLVYQPKIDLAAGQICGLEALLRWQHPERGLVSPGEFIQVLEETGLIVAAGDWVIRTACAQIRVWHEAGFEPVPVAVNVSARQFQLKDLDARIVALVRAANVDPRLLEIEITESYLAPDPQHAIRLLGNLRRAGIRVSIDDFGTGYSSLAYLTRFPVSSLKIDHQFVRDATVDPSDAAIVRAVIDMAHNLGFVVVAEGVETGEQAEFLQQHGCDQAQGFYFARPAPAEEVEQRLMRGQANERRPLAARRRAAATRRTPSTKRSRRTH